MSSSEIDEVDSLIASSSFPGVKACLNAYKTRLMATMPSSLPKASMAPQATVEASATAVGDISMQQKSTVRASQSSQTSYIPITGTQ